MAPLRQQKSNKLRYVARHIDGRVMTGTFAVIYPNKTITRLEALEQVNKWNRLSCRKGELCLWTYYLDDANGGS